MDIYIYARDRLVVTLRFLASGDSLKTSHIAPEVCEAIIGFMKGYIEISIYIVI